MDWDTQCGGCGAHFQIDPSGNVADSPCPECGGTRLFRSQPSATQSDGTLRNMVDSDSQKDQGGNPLGEGTIVGTDGENGRGFRDNYMHSKVANPSLFQMADLAQGLPPELQRQFTDLLLHGDTPSAMQFLQEHQAHPPIHNSPGEAFDMLSAVRQAPNDTPTVSKSVEMRTLNMEPYAPLWDESYIPPQTKEAGFLAPLVGAGADLLGSLGGGSALRGMGMMMPTLMNGVLGGGQQGQQQQQQQPQGPDPAPPISALGSADIPMLLLADLETPGAVKSVDEQHDDPEHQDQKEFNDGDDSPSNHKNPNNEDSGADGEDGVRDATPGYGFGENSPGLERAMMILPLLLHYFQTGDSGQSDPLVKGLHDALERENPGYLDQEHPDGQKYVQLVIQQHGSPQHHAGAAFVPAVDIHSLRGERVAGVNAFPSGLPDVATPGAGLQGPGGGRCPSCGGTLAGDGSCPQCGATQHPQGGSQIPTGGGGVPMRGGGGGLTGTGYPPGVVSNHQGPVTEEQKGALHQLIDVRPELFGDILDQIQHEPNSPPLVNPGDMTPPSPPPAMMNPPGGMPVNDPSQAGGGMPMQPMARTASEYGYTCPACLHHGDTRGAMLPADCPSCGISNYTMWDDDPDLQHRLSEPHALDHQFELPSAAHPLGPHAGKTADANNAVPRCPDCGTATTSLVAGLDNDTDNTKAHCHSCGTDFSIKKDSRTILTDLVNPVLQNAAQQHETRPEGGQDSSMTWVDAQGAPLEEGRTYELHAPGFDIPDEVQVVSKKPDQLGLKLVGEFSNLGTHTNEPDFTITPQQVSLEKYEFVPSGQGNDDQAANEQPLGGMPGLEQIPQSGDTTDEASNSYPNKGTVSQVLASVEGDYEDLCHKCGGNWIDHVASSSTTTMHECARCGAAWETHDQFEGRQAGVDLSYILDDARDDGFFSQMERARSMAEYGQSSRSLATIASKDERLQAVRDVLERNKDERHRVAGRHFTPSEQRALINERGKARNADLLDLSGTHYETRFDPTGKANPYNVPDAHLLLGL